MDALAVILFRISDVLGVKWIRSERKFLKKLAKMLLFLVGGILLLIAYLVISY